MTCTYCDDTSVIRTDYAYSIPCPACAEPPELCSGCGLPLDDCDVYRVGEEESYHAECIALSPVLLAQLIVMPALTGRRLESVIPPSPRLPRELRDTVRPMGGAP